MKTINGGQVGDRQEVPTHVEPVDAPSLIGTSSIPLKTKRAYRSRLKVTAIDIKEKLFAEGVKIDVLSPTQLCDERGFVILQYKNDRVEGVCIYYHFEFASNAIRLAAALARTLGSVQISDQPLYFNLRADADVPTKIYELLGEPDIGLEDLDGTYRTLQTSEEMIADDSVNAKQYLKYIQERWNKEDVG